MFRFPPRSLWITSMVLAASLSTSLFLSAHALSRVSDIEENRLEPAPAPPALATYQIPPDHWSYQLVQKLVEQTGMTHHQGTIPLDGSRPLNRTEMAILVSDLSGVVTRKNPAHPVDERSQAQFEILQQEFQSELNVLKARIEKVETNVDHLKEEVKKSAIPDDAYVHIGKKGKVQLYGQIHSWYTTAIEDGQENKNIRLRRANLGVKGNITEDWRYNVMFDPVRNDHILKDYWLEYTGIPHHAVRIGQYRILTYDANRSLSRNFTFERSQIGQVANIREQGVSLLGKWKYLDYHVGAFNGDGDNAKDENDRLAFAGRAVLRPIPGLMDVNKRGRLEMGASVFDGQAGSGSAISERDRYGFEARYHVKNVELNSEYLHFTDPGAINGDGLYVEGVYKLNPKWHLVARYDTLDPDKSLAGNRITDYLAGVNYLWDKYNVRLGMFYVYRDDKADISDGHSVTFLMQQTF